MDRPWWCAQDGAPARYAHASLDPLHPFVLCSARVGPFSVAAHGGKPVPGVATEYARGKVLAEIAAQQLRKRHTKHLTRKLVKGCPYCNQLRDRIFAPQAEHATP